MINYSPLSTTCGITVGGTGLSTITGQLYVGSTADYFGSSTVIQLISGASNKNVGIRSNILYLYSYNNGSTAQLVFGDGSANFGLFSNDTEFALYNYGTASNSITVNRATNAATFAGDVTSTGIIKSNRAEAQFKLTSTHGRETVLGQGGGNFHILPDHGSGVGISYGNTTYPGLLKLYNNTTAKITLDASAGTGDFTGNVTAPSFIGKLMGGATGAPDATIWCVSGDYTNWGIFYDESTPDLIQFKSSGNTKATISLDHGDYTGRNATFTGTATATSFVSSTDSGININGITMTRVAANSAIRVGDGLETLGLLRSYAGLNVATTGTFGGLVSGITPVDPANFVTKAYVDGGSGGTGPFLPLAGGTMTGDLNLTYAYPRINLTDTNHNSDYSIINNDGTFSIYDITNNSHRLSISAAGNATFAGDLYIPNKIIHVGDEDTWMQFETNVISLRTGGTDRLTLTNSTATFAGSLTIPDYIIHAGDTDTKFGFAGVNDYRVHIGGSDRFRITGDVHVKGATDFAIPAGRKLYLDGQSNTYITESSADNIKFFTGGSEALLLNSSQNATFAGNVLLGDDKNLDFGSATDFRIVHNSTTNVNHISSKLDRQLSINANIINLTNQANTANYLVLNSTSATFAGTIDSGTITSTGIVKTSTTFQSTGGSMLFFVPNVGQALEIAQNTGNATFAGDLTVEGGDIQVGSSGQLNLGDDSSILSIGRGNEIWTQNTVDADATLYLNYRGYNNASTRFRSFDIRDGKGAQIALFHGPTRNTTFSGTVTIPSYVYHSGDPNTYFGFSGNDVFQVNTAGGERMRITASGMKLSTSGATVSVILDEDNMSSNSATALATQQSIKAYVDNSISGGANYLGVWDPDDSLNNGYGNPNLQASTRTDTSGDYFICSADGAAHPNGGTTEPDSWHVGDWVVWNEDLGSSGLWQKIDNTTVLSGGGTTNKLPIFTDSETIGDSRFSQNSTSNIITGPGNTASDYSLSIRSAANAEQLYIHGTGEVVVTQNYFYVAATQGMYSNGLARLRGGITNDQSVLSLGGNGSVGNLTLTSNTSAAFAGNVTVGSGLGAVNTDGTLTINGGSGTNGEAYLNLSRGGTSGFILNHAAGNIQIRATANIPMYFYTNGSIRQTIAAGGNVGIGTTSPLGKLMVREDSAGNPTRLIVSNGGTVQSGTTARLSFYEGISEKGYIERRRDGSGKMAFYTPADDNPFVWENPSGEIMRITNSNVGIGTTSPDSKLDVKGPSATPADGNQTLSITNTTGGTQLNIGTAENSYGWIEAREGSTLRNLLINPNGGNVGIGTTSPTFQLHVNSAVNGVTAIGVGNTGSGASRVYFDASNGDFSGSDYMWIGQNNDLSGEIFMAQSSGSFNFKSQPAGTVQTNLTITQAGNVGIGTTSPSAPLEIYQGGSGKVTLLQLARPNTAGLQSNIQFTVADIMVGQIQHEYEASNLNHMSFTLRAVSGSDIIPLWLENSGNVGIGTTSPASLLHIQGSTYNRVETFFDGSYTSGWKFSDLNGGIKYDAGSDNLVVFSNFTGTGAKMTFETQGSEKMRIDSSGNVGIGVTNSANKLRVEGSVRINDSGDGQLFFGTGSLNKIVLNGTDMEFWSGGLAASITMSNQGLIKFGLYGLGGTGTPTALLGVDNSGNVVKTTTAGDLPGGPYFPLAGSVYDGNTGSWSNGVTGNLALVSASGTKGIIIGDEENGAGQLSVQFNSNNGGGILTNNGGNLEITAQNFGDGSDIIFKGNDTSNNLVTYFQTVGASQKVRFLDNIKLTIGNGDDLQIKHNGTDSYIENYTGDLQIVNYTDDKDIRFWSDNGSGGVTEYFRLDGQYEVNRFLKNARFNDGVKANFGTVDDLQIYHSGTHSFIDETGTGSLFIRADDSVEFKSYSADEFVARFISNDRVELYFNGSKKFETSNAGVSITGSLSTTQDISVSGDLAVTGTTTAGGTLICEGNITVQDSDKLQLGNSQDLELYHSSGVSYIDNDTGHLYIRNNVDNDDGSNIYIQAKSGENSIICNDDSSVVLYNDNSAKFYTTTSGVGALGYIGFGSAGTSTGTSYGFRYGSSSPSGSQGIVISVSDTGGAYFDGVGRFQNTNTGQGAGMFQMVNYGSLYGRYMQFFRGSTSNIIGYIGYNSSNTSVTFSTTNSDIRTKKNITTWDENVLDKFKALQPKRFDFKVAIGDKGAVKERGFIAQYEKDNFPEAYQLNGNDEKATYGFHPMEMVPYMMKAIKDLTIKNEELERRIKTLES